MEIKADVKSIEKLKDYFYVVPDYQREYVWESDKQVERFLQDINDEFDPTGNKKTNYFIGSVIIVKNENGTYDVIDGQQRLTTIIISLCVMRNILEDHSSKISDDIIKRRNNALLDICKELLYKYNIKSGEETPRLILQYDESKDYLTTLITCTPFNEAKTNSIKKMEAAFEAVDNHLSGLINDNYQTLLNFVAYFLTNVEMVIIIPDDLGSALKIFETINERGVGLNAMDLVKNLIFRTVKETEFNKIKEIWKNIIQNIEKSGDGENQLRFLRYFIIARYHDGIIREEEIYKWIISNEGKTRIGYENDPIRFIKELEKASERYCAFIKATQANDYDPDYPSVTAIGHLAKKNSRQHLILLLALNDSLDKTVINLLADNLESLFFYFAANNVLTKYYETVFVKWAVKLRGIKNYDELKEFINNEFTFELDKRMTDFIMGFGNKTQNDLNPQYRIKYVLGKIDDYICQKVNFPSRPISYYQNLQLEHILPQTGINIPPLLYPNVYDYQQAVYKFGNLTLLEPPINQSLNHSNDLSSDVWFQTKKTAYLNSNILLTKTFSDVTIGNNTAFNNFTSTKLKSFDEWNMTAISDRQHMIERLITDIWNVK